LTVMPCMAALWNEADNSALAGAMETDSPCAIFRSSPI
jgi:hypothetical protein